MGDGKTCEELDDWKKGMEETKACLGNICISKQRHPPKKKLYRVLFFVAVAYTINFLLSNYL